MDDTPTPQTSPKVHGGAQRVRVVGAARGGDELEVLPDHRLGVGGGGAQGSDKQQGFTI